MTKKLIAALVLTIAGASMAYADKYTLKRDALPQQAQEMLLEYFPKAKVAMIKVDKHLLKKTGYDVKLTNGTKLEFNNAGKWTSVDYKTRAVPENLIPKAIRRHVGKNYADAKIVSIEKKAYGYKIELSDGLELKYDHIGTFKGAAID